MRQLTLSAVMVVVCAGAVQAQEEPAPGTETIDAKPVSDAPPKTLEESTPAKDVPGLTTSHGWDAQWALLFTMNNWIGGGAGFLGQTPGATVGGEYFLGHDFAVRAMASVSRFGDKPTIVKTTSNNGGDDVTGSTFTNPGNTSTGNITVRAEGLWRLMDYAVAPYAGGGVFIGWNRNALKTVNDVTVVDQVTTRDRVDGTFSFGARGVLGAEWRLHPNFSIFAEYEVIANIFQQQSGHDTTIVETTVGETRSVTTNKTEYDKSLWLSQVGYNGLAFGGALGLAVHFQ